MIRELISQPWELLAQFSFEPPANAETWLLVPAGLAQWSFAIDTTSDIEPGGRVDVMVANDHERPKPDAVGAIALTLSQGVRAGAPPVGAYRWVRTQRTYGPDPVYATIVLARFVPSAPRY